MKALLIAMGASEGAEAGKDVLGATGEFVGGETGRKIGEATGSVAGGTAGGYANVVRYNTLAKGTKMGVEGTSKAVSSVPEALRAAKAAKAAGDERNLFEIFMDQYGDLRKGGLGFMQERTNSKIRDLITRDPRSEKAITSFRDSTAVLQKGEDKLFSTSQISDNPTLYKMELMRRERPEGMAVAQQRSTQRRTALMNAYKNIVDKAIPTDTKTMQASINALATTSVDNVRKLEESASDIRGSVRNFSSEERRLNGSDLRLQYDNELAASKAKNVQNYERALSLDTQGVDIGQAKGPIKDVLKQFEVQIKEGTAPSSISNLKSVIDASEKKQKGLIEIPEGVKYEAPKPQTRIALRDVNQVIKDLGADVSDAYAAYGRSRNPADLSRAQNLTKVQDALLASVGTANPEAASAYHSARSRYATEHAPRFNTGIASAMEIERTTPGTRGRPRIPDETLLTQFLNKSELPTRMDEFDKLFGGYGGAPKNAEAYRLLGNAIEDRFSKEVLNEAFSPDKAMKFVKDYESALTRTPNIRTKLVDASERLDKIRAEQQRIEENFQQLVGSPITKEIGPLQAQQLFVKALSDPDKMQQLLKSDLANTPEKAKSLLKEAMAYANPLKPDGGIDYTKFAQLMQAGQYRIDMPNTLEMLTTKALGEKEGAAHMDRLRQISELMRRDAQLDPEHLRLIDPASWSDPVKRATGQSMASWYTGFRSMDVGFGRHYFPLIAAGRFVNTRIQQAVETTIEKALYDPEASQALLSMVATPSNQPIGSKVLDVMFGSSTELRKIVQKDLLEHGLVRSMAKRGSLIGVTKLVTDQQEAQAEKERAKKREQRRRNVDLGE